MPDSEDLRFARLLDWVEGRLSEEEARAVERQVAQADSGMQPAPGLRTAGTPESQRQFVYSTDAADVTIDVRPRPQEELLDLDGQIFPINDTDPGGFDVRLLDGPSEVATTATNDLGEFTFEAVSPGVYEVLASSDRVEIRIPRVEVRRGA